MIKHIKIIICKFIEKLYPHLKGFREGDLAIYKLQNNREDSKIDDSSKIYTPSLIQYSTIGRCSYIATNSHIQFTKIGNFCSIGPNFHCGLGIHPTNGLSTHPMFYSKYSPNGKSLSNENKINEFKHIEIGNDVFIGANVTVLDGITIGNGAIIGAGAVVTKNIPDYAIAVGCPIKIIKFRFTNDEILKLNKLEWWNWDEEKLQEIEKHFFNIQTFLDTASKDENN